MTGTEVVFLDVGGHGVSAQSGCVQQTPQEARCPLTVDEANLRHRVAIRAAMSDGDDEVATAVGSRENLLLDIGGGRGDDRLSIRSASRTCCGAFLDGGPGQDTVLGSPRAEGLGGGPGDDILRAGPGADQLYGGGDDDFIDGGSGRDVVHYSDTRRAVRVDLIDPGPDGRPGERDRIRGIEDIEGGAGPDVIVGNARGNWIRPGEGRDRVIGRGGDDRLDGDPDDRLLGGPGDDYLYPLAAQLNCGPGQDAVPTPDITEAALIGRLHPSCEWYVDVEAGWTGIWVARALRRSDRGLHMTLWSRGLSEQVQLEAWVIPHDGHGRPLTRTTETVLRPGQRREVLMPLTAVGRRHFRRPRTLVNLTAQSDTWGSIFEGPIALGASP